MSLLERTFLALDGMSKNECFELMDRMQWEKPKLKIGLELFCLYGPSIVQELAKRYDAEIFLDLKLHDIPNTVAKSIKSLAGLPIKFLTVHLSGGKEMTQVALQSRDENLPQTQILGVTFLTSLGQNDLEAQFAHREIENFESYLGNFLQATLPQKIDGVICSAWEASFYKNLHPNLICVCPGIRFADDSKQDQKRVCTPLKAKELTADYLVIGRAITKASDPQKQIAYLQTL